MVYALIVRHQLYSRSRTVLTRNSIFWRGGLSMWQIQRHAPRAITAQCPVSYGR